MSSKLHKGACGDSLFSSVTFTAPLISPRWWFSFRSFSFLRGWGWLWNPLLASSKIARSCNFNNYLTGRLKTVELIKMSKWPYSWLVTINSFPTLRFATGTCTCHCWWYEGWMEHFVATKWSPFTRTWLKHYTGTLMQSRLLDYLITEAEVRSAAKKLRMTKAHIRTKINNKRNYWSYNLLQKYLRHCTRHWHCRHCILA